MACACGSSGCSCEANLSPDEQARSPAAGLGSLVDCARSIVVDFGLRPYHVVLIWTRWSGGKRGTGVEDITRCLPLTPTPKVEDLAQTLWRTQSAGTVEAGSIKISQISIKYDEDILTGRWEGAELDRDQSFYYEVSYQRPNQPSLRRRYFPSTAPSLRPEKFEWVVNLRKVSEDRARNGET